MSAVLNVPEGWEVKTLGNIAKFKGGNGFNEDYQGGNKGDYPFLKVSDMSLLGNEKIITVANHYVYQELVDRERYTVFSSNTIVFAKVGAALLLNRRRLLSQNSIIDNNMMGAVVKNNFTVEYLYFILTTIDFANYVQTGAVPSVNQETLANIEVHVPKKIKEQQYIAKILITLDQAIEATQKLIAKEKNIKKGLMHDLLTNGIDSHGQIRTPQTHNYKESELGLIPEEWELLELNNLISKVMDYRGRTPLKIGMEWGDGLIPSLSANNVQMGAINFKKETHLGSEKLFEKWMTKGETKKGDILFTMEAPLGNVAPIPDNNKYILSQRVILLRPNTKINEKYLFYYLMSERFKSTLLRYASGSTVKGIQYSKLKEINIIFPKELKEQDEITNILTAQDKKIETEETNLSKLKELKKGLMNDLLSGTVRVKS